MSVNHDFSETDCPPYWGLSSVPGGLNDEGLTTLTTDQHEFCNFWYDEVEHTAQPGMRPEHITAFTEARFAHAVHKLVADNVSIDRNNVHHKIVPRAPVTQRLNAYYTRFPANAELSETDRLIRRQLQDDMLETTHDHAETYGELEIVYALRRAFRDRHQKHSTRAMFGLLTAYGRVIRSDITE